MISRFNSGIQHHLPKQKSKTMKKILFGMLLALAGAVSFTACSDKGDDPKNIVQLAQDNSNLSSLVAALQRADLVSALEGDGPFTVFAPTDAAFATFLQANGFAKLEDVPVDLLKQVLLYHVVGAEARSNSLSTGYVNALATYGATTAPLSLFVNTASGVKINDATVTLADVTATNGVVHVIDKVLVPPTVVNHALNNPAFSTLVAALTRSDLGVDYVGLLSGAGPFTVFAPTNAAFTALLAELGANGLADIDAATLNAVLQYHVVSGANVRSGDLTEGQVVTTFSGGTFTIGLTDGAKITDARGRVANIAVVDVQASNGVVHAIDKVILP
jgi:uncharacterized surface protein with fasciclin (FAS1) repeats